MPATGLAGRCAVVPDGNWKYPLSVIVVLKNVAIKFP
jgi:hypothetical protein